MFCCRPQSSQRPLVFLQYGDFIDASHHSEINLQTIAICWKSIISLSLRHKLIGTTPEPCVKTYTVQWQVLFCPAFKIANHHGSLSRTPTLKSQVTIKHSFRKLRALQNHQVFHTHTHTQQTSSQACLYTFSVKRSTQAIAYKQASQQLIKQASQQASMQRCLFNSLLKRHR